MDNLLIIIIKILVYYTNFPIIITLIEPRVNRLIFSPVLLKL